MIVDNLQDEPEFYSDVRKLLSCLKNRLTELNNLTLTQFPDLNERNKLRLYAPIIENLFSTRNNKGNLSHYNVSELKRYMNLFK